MMGTARRDRDQLGPARKPAKGDRNLLCDRPFESDLDEPTFKNCLPIIVQFLSSRGVQSVLLQLLSQGDFQGSRVTSDGGLILVLELDERLGLEKLIEEHLSDSRQ